MYAFKIIVTTIVITFVIIIAWSTAVMFRNKTKGRGTALALIVVFALCLLAIWG